MKVVSKGFDPDLGRKFAQEHSGFVIGRAKQLPKESAPRRSEKDMPPGLDAQQQHDWLNGSVDEDYL